MKMATTLVLLCGLLFGQHTHATEAKTQRPQWVIILTVTDVSTGSLVEKRELDADLQFDDLAQCRSIVARVGAIPPSDHFTAVLTCRKAASN
jgi:hypothetical protein